MDQSRALNALAPYLALAKSANSPRAAADLITQATSQPNTYVFAELLQQPNIQALAGHEQHGNHFTLLQIFAWGTWSDYKANRAELAPLSDAQELKLKTLSLLTVAASKPAASSTETNLSYSSLCAKLDLSDPFALEHLVTHASYNNLLQATLNPANQTVVITSVAPLRDLAPGSVQSMVAELDAWSGRCDAVLAELEAEIARVRAEAAKRHAREKKAEQQIAAVTETDKGGSSGGSGGVLSSSRTAHNTRGASKRDPLDDDDDDLMEIDGNGGGGLGGGGKKRSAGGGLGGMLRGLGGGRSGR